MLDTLLGLLFSGLLVIANLNLKELKSPIYDSRLICVNAYTKYFSFGNASQITDMFWLRFLQELDAFNKLEIAEPHLCPDKVSSWHFHIVNVAMDLDPKFYELNLHAPLLVGLTISDVKGASILFDKSVENFPDDWRILYRASYQAVVEENNPKKAADLLYRAGQRGAPTWVKSLAGGLYNETGNRKMAELIYGELLADEKNVELAKRLKQKLENKIKNFYRKTPPKNDTE